MANEKMGRGADQFPLRLPSGMRDRIKAAARQQNRSMNAEIVATLEEKYPAPAPGGFTFNDARRIKALVSQLSKDGLDDDERRDISVQINLILEGGGRSEPDP